MSQPIEHSKPEVTKMGPLDMQVCVPCGWTDEQVKRFAEAEYPCGLSQQPAGFDANFGTPPAICEHSIVGREELIPTLHRNRLLVAAYPDIDCC